MPEQIPELPLSQLRSMLSTMYRIRAFEEKVDEQLKLFLENPYLLL
jgi:TPP-dependent pyruvate/acetoin dehydrogenase alpha subunit